MERAKDTAETSYIYIWILRFEIFVNKNNIEIRSRNVAYSVFYSYKWQPIDLIAPIHMNNKERSRL
jgi:hypothetical protein